MYIPNETKERLNAYVSAVWDGYSNLDTLQELTRASPKHSRLEFREDVPLEDGARILRLAMLTECATDSYAAKFDEGAHAYGQEWLAEFNRLWTMDEYLHTAPFKSALCALGFSEEELDREIREVQEETYEHCCGKSPASLTLFGVLQEYLTDQWYRLILALLQEGAGSIRQGILAVKKRETLHTVWYRELTALQVQGNPDLLPELAETVLHFRMPGNSFPHTKEDQKNSLKWLQMGGLSLTDTVQSVARHVHGTLNRDTGLGGKLLLSVGKQAGGWKSAIAHLLSFGLERAHAEHLLAEALFQRIGIPVPDRSRIPSAIRSGIGRMVPVSQIFKTAAA